jgi:putative MATE family efflux protein
MKRVSIKEINRLAFPAIIAGIAEPVIGLADTAIIGNFPVDTEASLAAVGLGSSFFLTMLWIMAQTKSAISAIISKYYGSDRIDEVKTLVPQSIALNVAIGLITFAVTSFFAVEIFSLYNAEDKVLEYSVSYYSIRSIGYPFTLATFAIFGIFRGVQNTLWAMWISISGAGLNIILDIILVYGVEGYVEPMGVEGAAYATLSAQMLMFLLALGTMYRKTAFRLRPWFPRHPELANLFGMSANLAVRTISLNVAFFAANAFATLYGNQFIAAHSIAIQIWLFSSFLLDGYANAGNAISGRLLGGKRWHALNNLSKDLVKISLFISVGLSLCYFALYPFLGSFFTVDKSVSSIFDDIFWIVIIMQPVNAIAFTYDGIFKGLGETNFLRNVLMISTFFAFLPLVTLFHFFDWKLYGIWAAFGGWMIVRSVLPIRYFAEKYGSRVP